MVIDREKAIAIGEGLRIKRESKSLTLDDVSATLKIRKLYLQKLEAGEVEEIPGLVYQKLYLKTYCNFLDIMQENFPTLPDAGNENKVQDKDYSSEKVKFIDRLKEQKRPTRFVLGVSVAILLMLILYYNF